MLDIEVLEFLFQYQLFVGSVRQVRFRRGKISVTACACPNVPGCDLDMRTEPICGGVPNHQLLPNRKKMRTPSLNLRENAPMVRDCMVARVDPPGNGIGIGDMLGRRLAGAKGHA